ncbi:hypothetical protein HMPREF1408_01521 [Helicobacter pylori GAM245Ai]|nr:hypothetical protein HMPREF1408_01521 [Helicobacter pylori GAM245Ai]
MLSLVFGLNVSHQILKLKTFIETQNFILNFLKNGVFNFNFYNKTHSLKGIGGYFEITLPLNPLKIPLTQEDRFFSKVIACLTQALLLLDYKKYLSAFFKG